jgi:EmrB/QacA subfamily drug resistance transporter
MSTTATQRAALLVAMMSAFATPFMGSAINIALPTIGQEYQMDAVRLGWVATAYLLAAATFLVPFGRLADIYGRKRIFTIGTLAYGTSSLLCALAPSGTALIIFRAFEGASVSMIFGTGTAILTSVYPATERGKVLGLNVAAVYLGLSLGPTIGGFLTQLLGWRSVFLVNIPFTIIVVTAILWQLKGEWAEARGEKFDFPGSIIYGIALIAIMYGLSLLPEAAGAGVILAGVLGIVAFVAWELRTPSPVLDVGLFRGNPAFAFSNLAALVNYSATAGVGFLMSLYLQSVKGLGPESAGLVMIAQPIMQAIFSPFAGRLSDRTEPRLVASAGMVLTVIGLSLFTLLNETTSLLFIMLGLVFLGLGFALFSSPNTNAVMSSVAKRSYGVAAATLGTMRLTGQMFSLGVAVLILAVNMGRVQITPQVFPLYLQSARIAFAVFAVLCVGGIFASLARGNMRS